MHKTKATTEEKIKAVEAYLSGKGSNKGWANSRSEEHESYQAFKVG